MMKKKNIKRDYTDPKYFMQDNVDFRTQKIIGSISNRSLIEGYI